MEHKSRVLVVDDEIGICEAVKRALESNGIPVDIALDGPAGLQAIKEQEYDLVLLDIKMPQISGLDLIKMIHKIDPDIICIMITGFATIEMAITAIKEGAYDFLTKPFSMDVLLLAVNQGLERRSLSLEAKRIAQVELEAKKLAEDKLRLEKLDQAKRQFLSLVTHELKSPVSAVENYLKLILQGYVDPENETQILEQCIIRTQEERKLIDDLMVLGQLEVIESPQVTSIHLGKILEDVLEESRGELIRNNLHLTLKIGSDIPEIEAVPEQIKVVWRNLINNAVKYTPEKGEILIGIQLEDSNLIGWIQDTGIGISDEDQKKLFSEFFRAANAKEAAIPGTGLGLVIVKRIVESLGGKICVASRLGEGSTFQFTIPLAKDQTD
jgi:two-component system, sensor histidine kinase and response regulator